MPRTVRKRSKTGVYHVIIRGIDKQCIFHDDEDRNIFLDRLKRYKHECSFEIYAYCLMSNHVHLLIKEHEESVSLVMKKISISYVYWYNKKYDRTGYLFQGRFISEPVENDSYLLTAARYIHQNPVKVGLTMQDWTSYSGYLKRNEIVDSEIILGIFGQNERKALENFIHFMNEQNLSQCLDSDENEKFTDKNAEIIIKELGSVTSCRDLRKLKREERDGILRKLKNEGLAVRQISRITGIHRKSIISA